ncbi:hypothetical protein AAG747_13585 [Rapidithrix thailandica]|uniref:Prenyltransferase n=1 Tax=Rapidithrix thailandica TaxID=413964 RepID=A0AAW9S7M2_9BACT
MLGVIYKYIRVLSLDIVVGACVGALFVASLVKVNLPWLLLADLALSVWLIYTFDHLLDARKITHLPSTFRHAFHQRHANALSLTWLFLAGFGICSLFLLPIQTLQYGLILLALVALYFLFLKLVGHLPTVFKELAIALIYTAGIFLGPLSLTQQPWSWYWLILFLEYAALAYINLAEFSIFELKIDTQDEHGSIARKIGEQKTLRMIRVIAAGMGGLMLAAVLLFYDHTTLFFATQLLFLLMLGSLLAIVQWPMIFVKKERYRIWGDLVFLYPLVFLLSK